MSVENGNHRQLAENQQFETLATRQSRMVRYVGAVLAPDSVQDERGGLLHTPITLIERCLALMPRRQS